MTISLISILPIMTASAETSGDYSYSVLDDGTVELTKYNGSDASIEIPSEIDGKAVTSIGDGSFSSCSSLTNVVLPDSITSIPNGLFTSCANLESVTIPESVTNIANNAFKSCPNLKSATIPSGVTKLEDNTFDACKSLTEVIIPDGVTKEIRSVYHSMYANGQKITVPEGKCYIITSDVSGIPEGTVVSAEVKFSNYKNGLIRQAAF